MKPFLIKRSPFSISTRLLLFVLPLLCLPIVIVGYITYRSSVDSVTRLSRNGQMLQVKAAAVKIDNIFHSCFLDLDTISGFLMKDIPSNARIHAKDEKGDRTERISGLFRDFLLRSPYYVRFRLLDKGGGKEASPADGPGLAMPLKSHYLTGENGFRISEISFSKSDNAFIVQIARPISPLGNGSDAEIVLDLDFSKVIELVNATRTGKLGFAFLVDQSGRTIAHPLFELYQFDLSKYDDPLLREVIVDMILGETGWRTYRQITEYAVAYAPVPSTGWSLALSIPIDEFHKDLLVIRRNLIEVAILVLAIALLCACLLPYIILRPMKDLASAAEKAAGNDLGREIPIRSNDEIGTLTRSLNLVIKRFRENQTELARSEKLISLGRLSAGVAHEVRNPLNAVKGAIIYLQKHRSQDAMIQEYTQLILEEINRLDKFVTKFLYFTKKSSPNREPTDLNTLINNTLNFLNEEFKRKGIEVSIRLDPSLSLMMIDPHQIEQVFLNLFVNSMHAMPDGGILKVSSLIKRDGPEKDPGPGAVVMIEDNGLGIPSEHYNYIYDLFFSTKEDGTGLGLPISLDIIKEHGGDMEIKSQEGEGTTVIIQLPLEDYGPDMEREYEKKNSDR